MPSKNLKIFLYKFCRVTSKKKVKFSNFMNFYDHTVRKLCILKIYWVTKNLKLILFAEKSKSYLLFKPVSCLPAACCLSALPASVYLCLLAFSTREKSMFSLEYICPLFLSPSQVYLAQEKLSCFTHIHAQTSKSLIPHRCSHYVHRA